MAAKKKSSRRKKAVVKSTKAKSKKAVARRPRKTTSAKVKVKPQRKRRKPRPAKPGVSRQRQYQLDKIAQHRCFRDGNKLDKKPNGKYYKSCPECREKDKDRQKRLARKKGKSATRVAKKRATPAVPIYGAGVNWKAITGAPVDQTFAVGDSTITINPEMLAPTVEITVTVKEIGVEKTATFEKVAADPGPGEFAVKEDGAVQISNADAGKEIAIEVTQQEAQQQPEHAPAEAVSESVPSV